jgi:hypothetical protein
MEGREALVQAYGVVHGFPAHGLITTLMQPSCLSRNVRYISGPCSRLGWFSIGLGLAEILAPRALCRALGMEGREALVQA